MTSTLPPVLSIAGSDSSGGAGIQADLKTMLANGVFGMTAIAALTAQNTTGVTMVTNTPPEMLAAQIDAVFEDIPPVAVKIGRAHHRDRRPSDRAQREERGARPGDGGHVRREAHRG